VAHRSDPSIPPKPSGLGPGGSGPPEGWHPDIKQRKAKWRMAENLRLAGQRDMDEYVPGRLPYLEKWVDDKETAEPGRLHEARPAACAICWRCDLRLPMPASTTEGTASLEEHLAQSDGPPVGEQDGRKSVKPSLWGEAAAEVETPCLS
jgi:hypothetical protein